jgi:hypothetical protein
MSLTRLLGLMLAVSVVSIVITIIVFRMNDTDSASNPPRITSLETVAPEANQPDVDTPEDAAHKPTPAPADGEWHEIASWSGTETMATETFDVSSERWRIKWTAKNGEYGGVVQVYVYDDGDNIKALAANTTNGGSDVSYVEGSGRHRLMINSVNANWTVTVESPE